LSASFLKSEIRWHTQECCIIAPHAGVYMIPWIDVFILSPLYSKSFDCMNWKIIYFIRMHDTFTLLNMLTQLIKTFDKGFHLLHLPQDVHSRNSTNEYIWFFPKSKWSFPTWVAHFKHYKWSRAIVSLPKIVLKWDTMLRQTQLK